MTNEGVDRELQDKVIQAALWWASVLGSTAYTPYAELSARLELAQAALELKEHRE